MPGDRGQQRVPTYLGVEVRVQIDKAGCHGVAFGVDLPVALVRHLTDRDDAVTIDRDIARYRSVAESIDDQSIANYEIMCRSVSFAPQFQYSSVTPMLRRSRRSKILDALMPAGEPLSSVTFLPHRVARHDSPLMPRRRPRSSINGR